MNHAHGSENLEFLTQTLLKNKRLKIYQKVLKLESKVRADRAISVYGKSGP